ncbi:hypothetical protein CC1G_01783 [Coprinopsis cinerea okayama7|uniref:C3H1-type domain-containing protein n=1 Tax=Coprinopsis cinerea (strain Okayama-7 / 130 / ATCC MYA-4618 / FGSC 9003) TaxID=240176 RepID=A8N2N5_COPC7|nr:hypothetical protein CC1G_01783 [Coprinopsis cinerea okayama7\|eukprot:XP_001829103.2 hypothetical protein CC1G_01783 [Coprinopsis cinerea okayama7\
MVSPLWKACSEGDLDGVLALLNDASPIDIEIKDHTGSTPLIEAVKNGHIEVVRALLNKGADPSNASSQGPPEQFTSDPAILDLLKSAQTKLQANKDGYNENGYPQNPPTSDYPAAAPPPPGPYPYYPTINPSLSTMGDPAVFYPPPPPGENGAAPNGIGHLPPPEVARMIPCRYFPACRYGPQCMFAHPTGPYYQGPPPPGYPPFDPALGPNPYGYYPPLPPPPPQFQQPNGALSPPPQGAHHPRSPSEIVSPSQGHFPNGAPPPAPYTPMSPNGYPHPPVPMSGPPIPPLHHQPPQPGPGPQSPGTIYHNVHPIPPYPGADPSGQYLPPPAGAGYPEQDNAPKPTGQQEGYPSHPTHRDVNGPRRGGFGRRASLVGKKPACLFFPAGRCKNGDDCRFPHVLDTNAGPNHVTPPYYGPGPRGGAPRPHRGHHHSGPSLGAIEHKMGNMTIRDDAQRPNGANDLSKPKFPQGPKHQPNGLPNGNKRPGPAPRPQRVPSADDFPVLPGSVTPPRVNGNNHSGPTAAQVLRAPAPVRSKPASEDGAAETRGPSPDAVRTRSPEATNEPAKVAPAPATAVVEQPQQATQPAPAAPAPAAGQKLPVSFAAAAAAASSAPADAAPRVAISA